MQNIFVDVIKGIKGHLDSGKILIFFHQFFDVVNFTGLNNAKMILKCPH